MKKIVLLFLLFITACSKTNNVAVSPTSAAATIITPIPTSTLYPTPTETLGAEKFFSEAQLSAFNQYGLSFNTNNDLIQNFKDADGKEQSITVGHLEDDGLHVTDFGTGIETVISTESIVNYHQESNVLFNDILKGIDTTEDKNTWIFDSENGWFKQIKDGDTVTDEKAFDKTDNRILLSELVDSNQINALFPADAVPADFFLSFETDKNGTPFAYFSIYRNIGYPGYNLTYIERGEPITDAKSPFHLWRTYYLRTKEINSDICTQVILNRDGRKTKTLEHFAYETGKAPQGDDLSNLVFPLLRPLPSAKEARAAFDSGIGKFNYVGRQDLTALSLLNDDILSSPELLLSVNSGELLPLNQIQIASAFTRNLARPGFGAYIGPYGSPPSLIQQGLLVPLSWRNPSR